MHYNTLLLNYDATEQDFQDYNIPRSVLAKLFTIRNHKKVTSHFAQNYCESYIYKYFSPFNCSLWKCQ